ncbi:MAG: HEAT repeat domain-containing protein [Phycisphaeraceae bacterium]|nr:HEAT repeat domain-containing protein [Phycisphaeraceae bacterium]
MFRAFSIILAGFTVVMVGCNSTGNDHFLATLIDSPPTPQEAARDAFNVYDADVRRRSVNLIAASPFGHEPPYLRMYRLLSKDPDPTVRAAAVRALGMHGLPEDGEIVVAALEDDATFVRWEAAKALQRLHHPDAVEPLLDTLRTSDDPDVRMAVARALGQYPSPAVFNALVGALNDSEFGTVHAAHSSLTTLTGQQLGIDAQAWLAWADENRDGLFAQGVTYTYEPWVDPPGLLDKMQFWKKAEEPEPQVPRGLESEDESRDG